MIIATNFYIKISTATSCTISRMPSFTYRLNRELNKMCNKYFYYNYFISVIIFITFLSKFKSTFSTHLNMEKHNSFHQISNSCSAFSSNLFQVLASEQTHENIVISSFSVYTILSLLFHGLAEGTTKEELKHNLHVMESDQLEKEFPFLLKSLNDTNKAELEIANAIYIDDKVKISDNFVNKSEFIFLTSVNNVNFKNNIDAVTQINSWIKKETRGKLVNVISSSEIDQYVKIILINIFYFKSSWLHPFDSELTESKIFYNINTFSTYVPTMTKIFNVEHGQISDLNANFIKIKYSDTNFEMIIVLPKEKYGLNKLEKNFDWKLVLTAPCSIKEVEIFLPKFKIETSVDLKRTLKQIGITSIFTESANFHFLSETSVHVDEILQKLFIEVDEIGSEAAVATVAKMRSRRMIVPSEVFIVDHPFMFVIQHVPSSIPLFKGSIRKLGGSKDEL